MKTPPINALVADLFPDTVTARRITGRDIRGKPTTWDAPITLTQCKVMGDGTSAFQVDGEQVTASVRMLVNGYYSLTTDWEYTLPARYANRTPRPIHVDSPPDENGPHHQRVFFA